VPAPNVLPGQCLFLFLSFHSFFIYLFIVSAARPRVGLVRALVSAFVPHKR
jgi:hypothetical protein